MAGKTENDQPESGLCRKTKEVQSEEEIGENKEDAKKEKRGPGRPRKDAEKTNGTEIRKIDAFLVSTDKRVVDKTVTTTAESSLIRELFEEMKKEIKSELKQNLIEIVQHLKKVEKRIDNVELEIAKNEKRWGKERAELLDMIRQLENKVVVSEENTKELVARIERKNEEGITNQPLRTSQKEMVRIWKALEEKEKKERKNNVVINGVREDKLKTKMEVEEFLREELDVNVTILQTFKAGREKNVTVIKLASWEDKLQILKNKKKLGKKRIFIDNDLSSEERDIQRKLIAIRNAEREKGKATRLGFLKICIDGNWLSWENLRPAAAEDRENFQ